MFVVCKTKTKQPNGVQKLKKGTANVNLVNKAMSSIVSARRGFYAAVLPDDYQKNKYSIRNRKKTSSIYI
jgi:hypothetical protein